MRILALMLAGIFALGTGGPVWAAGSGYPSDPANLENGQQLAVTYCGACHAVSETDTSAEASAPPFRELSGRYPLETLEESLAEGIVTAHENMPEIAFEPGDIDAFLGYLTSIQAN